MLHKIFNIISSNKQLIISLSLKLLAIVSALYVNRWLNSNLSSLQLAQFNLALTNVIILINATSFGLAQSIYHFFLKNSDKKLQKQYFSTVLFLQFSFYLFCILAMFSFSLIVVGFDFLVYFLIFSVQYILTVDNNFRSLCDIYNKSWQFSLTDLVGKVSICLGLIVISVLNLSYDKLLIYLGITFVIISLQYLVDFVWQKKLFHGLTFPKFSLIKENLPTLLILGINGFMVALSANTDKNFINYFGYGSDYINGYSNAYKLFELSTVLPSLTVPIIFSKYIQYSPDKIFNIKNKYLLYSILAGIISAVGYLVVGYFVLQIIDPLGLYLRYAYEVLPILAIGLTCSGISLFLSLAFVHYNKTKLEFLILLAYNLILFGLYYLLIPPYGHIGAGIATSVGTLAIVIIRLLVLRITTSTKLQNSTIDIS